MGDQTINQTTVISGQMLRPDNNGLAIAGFILALIAYPLFFLVIPWLLGTVFSSIGLHRALNREDQKGKGLSIAGLVLALGPLTLFATRVLL